MKTQFLSSMAVIALSYSSAEAQNWKKHLVMEQGHCNTAVALDANGDKELDVIASFNGRVSLFIAPDWKKEIILYRFSGGGGFGGCNMQHSLIVHCGATHPAGGEFGFAI